MKQNVYSIRDRKVGAYMTPFFSLNDDTAVRSFSHACENPQSLMSSYPEDYSLHCIGIFDDESGELLPESPRFLCNAPSRAAASLPA